VSADIRLQADGKGSVYRIRHQCKARIPLIGGVVERFVLSQSSRAAATNSNTPRRR